ncbi:MAG TPA: RDD family protein [Pyrinomonadaceae bacterium]|jgi:uncharacterized RDD family membrane protein YckC
MEKYQTFFPRLVALLIDNFIMLPLGILHEWFRQAEFPPLFFYVWIPLATMVFPVYTILMHARFGQTLGKMWMNVKVLDASEEPLSFGQAILRAVPQLIFNLGAMYLGIRYLGENPESENVRAAYGILTSFAGSWALADILVFFFNDKRRALHDFAARSVVVRINQPN